MAGGTSQVLMVGGTSQTLTQKGNVVMQCLQGAYPGIIMGLIFHLRLLSFGLGSMDLK